jgi:NADH:ubiquinone oxidoreductase subunit K
MIPLNHLVIFTALLFLAGLYGALTRRNLVGILMSIEIMLNAVNINFVVFSASLAPKLGQIFVIFIIVMAAATASVGLAIVLAIYRNQKTIYTDQINLLKW